MWTRVSAGHPLTSRAFIRRQASRNLGVAGACGTLAGIGSAQPGCNSVNQGALAVSADATPGVQRSPVNLCEFGSGSTQIWHLEPAASSETSAHTDLCTPPSTLPTEDHQPRRHDPTLWLGHPVLSGVQVIYHV
ncbi:hypothetical protein LY78DRAFT_186262 [Colletotrichum sublineola]|nr:hypothetical protein LY78DRAFT_186262 [Colletotrichum sublineola]